MRRGLRAAATAAVLSLSLAPPAAAQMSRGDAIGLGVGILSALMQHGMAQAQQPRRAVAMPRQVRRAPPAPRHPVAVASRPPAAAPGRPAPVVSRAAVLAAPTTLAKVQPVAQPVAPAVAPPAPVQAASPVAEIGPATVARTAPELPKVEAPPADPIVVPVRTVEASPAPTPITPAPPPPPKPKLDADL